MLAGLRHSLRHRHLGLGPPRPRVVSALITKRGLGGNHPVAMADHVLGRGARERVLRLRIQIDLHHAVINGDPQLLGRRPARAVKDLLEARARVRPRERLLAVGEDLRAQLDSAGRIETVHVAEGRRQQIAPAPTGSQDVGDAQ